MPEAQTFLPANLRPTQRAPRVRRPRRPLRWWLKFVASTLACLGAGVLLANWRLESVEITECPGLPASAIVSLTDLRGLWIPAIDLDSIRKDVESWPGVSAVAIELKLPSTLRIQALPDEVCASIQMGRTWRGVTCSGRLSRRLSNPRLPVLKGFNSDEADLRSALSAGSRLCDGIDCSILSVRKITPSDFEITVADTHRPETPSVVKVLPQGSPSEQWWRSAALNGQAPAWADLRFDRRIVIRMAG